MPKRYDAFGPDLRCQLGISARTLRRQFCKALRCQFETQHLTKRGAHNGGAKGRPPYRCPLPPSKLPKSGAELSLSATFPNPISIQSRKNESHDWRAAFNKYLEGIGATSCELLATLGEPTERMGWWPIENWSYSHGLDLELRLGIVEHAQGLT